MSLNLSKVPWELKARPQWVCWREETRDGKPTKVPYNPANPKKGAKANDPSTWASFEKAVSVAKTDCFAGIGYEFSFYDPYCGIDLDECRNPKTGELKYCAQVLIDHIDSYPEASPSGKGAHIITKAKWPGNKHTKTMPCGMKIEVYDNLRYFTFTGHHLPGTPTTIKDRQAELEALHKEVFAKPQAPLKAPGPGPAPTLDLSDRELLDLAHQARNGDKFSRLWKGDTTGYDSPSEATAALLNHLTYRCGPDPARIDRLFRQSGLMREKWDRPQSGSTWGNLEIHKAIARATEFYQGPRSKPQVPDPSPKVAQEAPKSGPQAAALTKPTLKPITARDLAAKTFSPPRWAIPELLPEGVIILAGKPKAGKSWFALNLAVAVATGGVAMGKIRVEKGEALYLALEDSERRLQDRLHKIIPIESFPENLHFLTAKDFPPLHKGGLEALDVWLNEHPQARLVIIDTLARIKPPRGRNADSYDHDTTIIATLQAITIKHSLALMVVHHTKKVETDDFVEAVSGTYGLTGAADCIAVLIRKDRAVADAVLKITGRDVADIEKALKFHPDLGAWEILGEAQEFAASKEREDILLVLREVGPKTPAQLSKIIGKSGESIRYLLMKMKESGQIIRIKSGEYKAI